MNSRRAIAFAAVVGLTVPCLATDPAASAVAAQPNLAALGVVRSSGRLSPRLAQLAGSSTAADSRAASLSLPRSGPGSLVREPDGRLVVQIRTSSTAASVVARLKGLGARVFNVSAPYSTVTAAVAPAALGAIASDSDVEYVNEVLAPLTGGFGERLAADAAQPHVTGCQPTTPEGDTEMNVATARAANDLDGTGVTIGVLSDSFNTDPSAPTRASQDVATGDLPGTGNPCGHTTPVTVQQDDSGANNHDEGRALAELAHAMAPGARLAFATAVRGDLDFASRIDALRATNHASVLVDDIQYFDEPFFQDGPIANAANAASAAGVPYFSSAGNANLIVGGNDVSSYEAPAYRAATCPVSVTNLDNYVSCHDFLTGTGTDNADDITLVPGGGFGLDLQWAQPWGAVTNDYDVFLLNSANAVIAGSADIQDDSQEPFEFFGYTNTSASTQTVKLVVAKFSGGVDPRMKFVMLGAGGVTGVQYNVSTGGDVVGPSIFGHNGAATVGSTAAIPYNDANTSEPYSSRGPVTHYYEPTPSTTALGSPDVIAKPDFAATDNVMNVFFGNPVGGGFRFAGTSAAVAQAAGIGALLKERNPVLTPAEIMATLAGTARAVANNGAPTDVGGGYLDAAAAIASVDPLPGAPTDVVAVPGDSQAEVHWTAPVGNPGFPATNYIVTPTEDNVPLTPISSGSTDTSFVVPALTNGSVYTFTVTAANGNGPGPASSPSAAVTVGAPVAPAAPTLTYDGSTVSLTWAAPESDNGSPVTGFNVSVNGTGGSVHSFGAGTTSWDATGLTNGSPYTFTVAAVNAIGAGPYSPDSKSVIPGSPIAPAAPTPTTSGNGSATLTWHAPTPGPTATNGYVLRAYDNGQLANTSASPSTATTRVFTGLTNGKSYRFTVAGVNTYGVGWESPLSTPLMIGLPAAPTAVGAVTGNGRATVHWTAPSGNGSAITRYSVTPYIGTQVQTVRTFDPSVTTRTITGLTNGQVYTFKIAAANARGVGPKSNPSVAIRMGAPGAPTAVHAVAAAAKHAARIHWTAPTNNGAAITAYIITPYIGTQAQPARIFHNSSTTEIFSGLQQGRYYRFRVAAVNSRGTGAQSIASNQMRAT